MEHPYPPIAAYALISDCHSAALVSRDGSVDWCCFNRFDARPVFARLLDWQKGGYFRVAPKGQYTTTRRYLPETMMLETRFTVEGNLLSVVDFLPIRPESDPAAARAVHPHYRLMRVMRCEAGEIDVVVEFCPRFDYGLTLPRLEMRGSGFGVVFGGADALVFESEIPVTPQGIGDARGEAHLRSGDRVFAAVTYVPPHAMRVKRLARKDAVRMLNDTQRFWRGWSARGTFGGPYAGPVLESARVLKGLTHAVTGAIVAAPTTSLPEAIGGGRNWDYRYTWLRDSALTLYALFTLGYTEEAHAFMEWLQRTTAGRVEDLQILYGVGGENLLPEVDLVRLDGYRGSRPVRIGNKASEQFQLDVYGYILDTAWLYHRHGGKIHPVFWDFLKAVVEVVASRWMEPDRGIWESRGDSRHFVSSKVMAWVAVDRAIRLAEACDLPYDLERWQDMRRMIRHRVETEGVDPDSGAFVQAFGSKALDASVLLIPLVRFLPPHDARVRATINRIERELTVNGLVSRYLSPDGLPGGEGAFVICSWWLVSNLALAGEVERSAALFERLLGYRNDVGLLAEEIDPASGEFLGNFPQAFSHVGLIGAAMNLAKAGHRTGEADDAGQRRPVRPDVRARSAALRSGHPRSTRKA